MRECYEQIPHYAYLDYLNGKESIPIGKDTVHYLERRMDKNKSISKEDFLRFNGAQLYVDTVYKM